MKRGAAWEFQLERWHLMYAARGQAYIGKTHPAAKTVRGHMVYSGKGMPDFSGVLAGGTGVVFDAKESKGDRLSFGALAPHQGDELELVHRLGGLAFLAVRFPELGPVINYICPWWVIGADYWRWRRKEAKLAGVSFRDMISMDSDGWLGWSRDASVRSLGREDE